MVAAPWPSGAGAKRQPLPARARESCKFDTPGSTTAMRLRRSISSTRFIRANDSTTPPRWGVQPPASPVPAPWAITAAAC